MIESVRSATICATISGRFRKVPKNKPLQQAVKKLKLLSGFRVFSLWRVVRLRLTLVAHKEII
ncbi:MAG: hypothetical protein WBN75_01290 [Verrucomicrobiia bacterium]